MRFSANLVGANIAPQLARHNEIGVRYAHPVFGSVRLDYFYIETKKEILFNDISNLNENFDTRRDGFEFANEIALTPAVQVFTALTFTSAEFDNGAFDGKKIPLTPEFKWSAGLVTEPVKHLKLSMEATGVHDQFALNDFTNRFPMEDYWTLGGKLAYAKDNWEVFVRGQNLLGEEYSSFMTSDGLTTVNFNPAPKSYVEAGFRIEV